MSESPSADDATQDLSPQQLRESLSATFESAWQKALQGGPVPEIDQELSMLAEPQREAAREALVKIDQHYRQQYAAKVACEATVDLPGAANSAAAEATPSSLEETVGPSAPTTAAEATIDFTDAPPDSERTVDLPSGQAFEETIDSAQQTKSGASHLDLPTISGYEILGELGRGAMGVVYRARQVGLDRTVALKMILAGGHAGPEQLTRFQTEAQAVAQLQHPGIVQVHDVGEQNGLPYFSLEFVDGQPLNDEVDGKPVMPRRAAELVESISRAMHYAHEHGIVHRDLKPANILVTKEGKSKVSDFGLVKRLEDDSSQTRTGTILGTPSYMSPEQARGEKEVGPLADVYALGALLYCLLTGRPPFAAATALDTVMQVLKEEPVAPSMLQAKTPIDLETICLKCLQKEPEKRYASAEALADDLQRYLTGEPILARPVTNLERTWRWCQRNPRVAGLTAAAAALALVLMIGGPTAAFIFYGLEQEAVAAKEFAEEKKQEAEAERKNAEQQAQIARDNEAKAVAAEAEAQKNLSIANGQRTLALNTLQKLVYDAQTMIGRRPGMQDLKQSLLDTAMAGLGQLERSTEQFAASTKASAEKQLATVYMEIGQLERATAQAEKYKLTLETLHGKGELTHANVNLARMHEVIGEIARRSGDITLARSHFEQVDHFYEAAVQQDNYPANTLFQIRDWLARNYGNLGKTSLLLGDLPSSRRYYEEGLHMREAWANDDPDNVLAQLQLSGALKSISDVTLASGDIESAEQRLVESIKILEKVRAINEDRTVPWNIALRYIGLGKVHLMDKDPAAARRCFDEAIQILEPLREEDQKDSVLRGNVASTHYGLGTAWLGIDDEKSETHYELCRELYEQAYADDPWSASHKNTLMLALARCGNHERAATFADELYTESREDSATLFNVACGLALCSDAVARTNDDQKSLTGEPSQQEQYAVRAVAALREAISRGYRDKVALCLDPDLAPIQQRDDFQELVEGLETQRTPAIESQATSGQ